MKNNPKVSIIIPVYNGSNYLREAIDSALAQKYKNVEIIIVNDGSDDGGKTEEIARSYGEKIRYFYKDNGGVASALNVGIREMTGEYFSWLSHDDVYLPDKLEVQINFLRDEVNPVILYSDYYLIDGKSKPKGLHKIQHVSPDNFIHAIITSNPVNGCTALIPRQCFDDIGLFNEHLKTSQDYEMWIRMSKKYNFVHIQQVLIKSRLHPEQGTRTMSDIQLSEANEFYIYCLNTFSVQDIFRSQNISKAISYLSLAMNFRVRGFESASKYAKKLASENVDKFNIMNRYYQYLLLGLFSITPRICLFNYWKLIATSLLNRNDNNPE